MEAWLCLTDLGAFEAWCLTTGPRSEPWAISTTAANLQRLRFLSRNGLDLDAFTVEGAARVLATLRRGGVGVPWYNNLVKATNAYAEFRVGVRRAFPFIQPPPSVPKRIPWRDLRAVLRYTHPEKDLRMLRRALIWVSVSTGLRRSMVARLSRSDLNPEAGTIRIRLPTKRGQVGDVYVEPWFWSSRRPLAAYLRWARPPEDDPDALWLNWRTRGGGKRRVPRRAAAAYLYTQLREAGLEMGTTLNFNVGRHTALTGLHRAGNSESVVQRQALHTKRSSSEPYIQITGDELPGLVRPRPDPMQPRRLRRG